MVTTPATYSNIFLQIHKIVSCNENQNINEIVLL